MLYNPCVIHLSELYRHFTLVESADSRSLRCNIVQKYSCAGNKGDNGKSPTLCLLISFSLALSLPVPAHLLMQIWVENISV